MKTSSTAVERLVERAVADGVPADFRRKGPTKPTIRGSFVRDLVIGPQARAGVQILGARIEGDIDLRNARGPGDSACNVLKLQDCDLVATDPANGPALDACHSHLRRLSLIDCRTTGIHVSSAEIDGDVFFQGIRRWLGVGRWLDRPECWVRARGARIAGSLTLSGSKLRAPFAWPGEWADQTSPFGLDLRLARIAGTLNLGDGFSARGGVSLHSATIEGDLAVDGAVLWALNGQGCVSAEHECLDAQDVDVRGHLRLGWTRRFWAAGTVSLMGARTGGSVHLEGWCPKLDLTGSKTGGLLSLSRSLGSRGRHGAAPAMKVVLTDATITGSTWINDITALEAFDCTLESSLDVRNVGGGVVLNGSRIRRGMWIAGDRRSSPTALHFTGGTLGGDLHLSGTFSVADVSGCSIDGDLELGAPGPLGPDPFELVSIDRGAPRLSLVASRVARALKVGAPVVTSAREADHSMDWSDGPLRIRNVDVPWYPGWRLGEALERPVSGSHLAILPFLHARRDPEGRVIVDGAPGQDVIAFLDGKSDHIHTLNEIVHLHLERPDEVAEYLAFFCAYVWGDEGWFYLRPGTINVAAHRPSSAWRATAHVEYGPGLFKATFLIEESGGVSMIGDEPLDFVTPRPDRRFVAPVRWFEGDPAASIPDRPDWPDDPPVTGSRGWTEVAPGGDGEPIWRALQARQRDLYQPRALAWPTGWKRPLIDLRDSRVGSLQDDDGGSWSRHGDEPSQLRLSGLEYERLGEPETSTKEVTEGTGPRLPSDWGDSDEASRGSAEPSLLQRAARLATAAVGKVTGALSGAARRVRSSPESIQRLIEAIRAGRRPWERAEPTDRIAWLERQYDGYPPRPEEYRPQPYQQLAKFYRLAGSYNKADRVTFEKLKTERLVGDRNLVTGRASRLVWILLLLGLLSLGLGVQLGLLEARVAAVVAVLSLIVGLVITRGRTRHLKYLFFQLPFGFGLKTENAIVTFALVWLVGAIVFQYLAPLKVDTSPVGTIVRTTSGDQIEIVVPVVPVASAEPQPGQLAEVPCVPRESLMYALDVLVPVLDLRQEERCKVSAQDDPWALFWRVFKSLYAVLGWVLVSGLILTVSGVVRRQTEK